MEVFENFFTKLIIEKVLALAIIIISIYFQIRFNKQKAKDAEQDRKNESWHDEFDEKLQRNKTICTKSKR